MKNIAAALALVAAVSGAASAGPYALPPSVGTAPGYRVTADHEPVMTPQGVAALPPGTKITVDADGITAFDVTLVGPSSLDSGSARHHWTGELPSPGGYVLQFGRERSASMSEVHVVVTPDPQSFARITEYDYGWEQR